MATALHGKSGLAYWNGTALALVESWEMSIGASNDDITAMDSGGWRQRTPGIFEATGRVTLRNNDDDTVHTHMRARTLGGTAMALRLYENGTAGHYYSGSAFMNLDLSVAHDSPEEATYNFESHGAWTYT